MNKSTIGDFINDDDLSPLEDFTPLQKLIDMGGPKAERARKIMNQFTSKTSSKAAIQGEPEIKQQSSGKRSKYTGQKRYKSYN